MTELGRACGSGLETTEGGGASAVGAAAGAALSRSDALSPVADATVAASLVGDGSKTTENRGGCGHRCGRARARTRATAPSPEPVLRWAPMALAAPRPGVSLPRACGCGNGLGDFLCWLGRTSCAELSSCCVPRPPVFCRCRGRRPSGRTEAVASPEGCWRTREVKGPHWSLGPQRSQAWCWLPGHLGSQPIPWLRVCAPGRLSDDQGLW